MMADTGKKISDADKALMRRMKPRRKTSEMNEITAIEMQRSLNPYSDADRELLRRQPVGKPKPKKMQAGGMAGASPAEIRDEKERQRKENRKIASQRRDGQKAAKPLDIDKTPGKPASNFEQARNFSRLAEIDELRRQEEKRRRERARASRATVGMGPAKVTTGGGLGTMTQRDRSKPKMLKDGGAVCRGGRSAQRGTQFRGVR